MIEYVERIRQTREALVAACDRFTLAAVSQRTPEMIGKIIAEDERSRALAELLADLCGPITCPEKFAVAARIAWCKSFREDCKKTPERAIAVATMVLEMFDNEIAQVIAP